jgi:hypothetical protein
MFVRTGIYTSNGSDKISSLIEEKFSIYEFTNRQFQADIKARIAQDAPRVSNGRSAVAFLLYVSRQIQECYARQSPWGYFLRPSKFADILKIIRLECYSRWRGLPEFETECAKDALDDRMSGLSSQLSEVSSRVIAMAATHDYFLAEVDKDLLVQESNLERDILALRDFQNFLSSQCAQSLSMK